MMKNKILLILMLLILISGCSNAKVYCKPVGLEVESFDDCKSIIEYASDYYQKGVNLCLSAFQEDDYTFEKSVRDSCKLLIANENGELIENDWYLENNISRITNQNIFPISVLDLKTDDIITQSDSTDFIWKYYLLCD